MLDNFCEHLRPTLLRMLRAGMTFKEGEENLLHSNGYDLHVFQVGDESAKINFNKADGHKAHVKCDACSQEIHIED